MENQEKLQNKLFNSFIKELNNELNHSNSNTTIVKFVWSNIEKNQEDFYLVQKDENLNEYLFFKNVVLLEPNNYLIDKDNNLEFGNTGILILDNVLSKEKYLILDKNDFTDINIYNEEIPTIYFPLKKPESFESIKNKYKNNIIGDMSIVAEIKPPAVSKIITKNNESIVYDADTNYEIINQQKIKTNKIDLKISFGEQAGTSGTQQQRTKVANLNQELSNTMSESEEYSVSDTEENTR
ncbi:hypothetical protein [Spiroplasma citri]|uniref:hypothetical protein n=1 Tax=Spiroplasma citri TaxID=2133 RepID=UPI0013A097FB|nr:hypothetical protein [Spiroplasma citri]QIA75852.1 hypothetical protein GTU57_09695 [Spiroplasma citri]